MDQRQALRAQPPPESHFPKSRVESLQGGRAKQFFEQLYVETATYQRLIRLLSVPHLPGVVNDALDPESEGFKDFPIIPASASGVSAASGWRGRSRPAI